MTDSKKNPGSRGNSGLAAVLLALIMAGVHAPPTGATEILSVTGLDGSNGFTVKGGDFSDYLGRAVSGAGDVNGDGMDDLLIGAPQADGAPGRSGETYVVYGKSGFGPTLDLGMLDAASGLAIKGAQIGEWSGEAVSAAGDLNADGFDDLVIGAPNHSVPRPFGPTSWTHAGRAYVVFGAGNFAGGELALSELDGSNGFVFDASAGWNEVGTGVGGGGDFNGDGIADVLVSAPGGSPPGTNGAGETYVIFGHGGDFDAALDRYALDGTNGFILGGTFSGERTGRATSFAGDLNGDGFDDLLIGAPWYQRSYVVYGRATVPGPIVSLADLGTTGGFLIQGIKPGDRTGEAVGGAGDLNGDGIADLVVGAPQADNYGNSQGDHGQAYVVFGVASAVPEPDSAALFAFSLALFVARGRRSRAPRRPQRRGRD